jgi:hypothetical protein
MENKLSPEKYIISKARNLPFDDCFISEDWMEKGLATIFLTKKMPGGNYIMANYLVDVFCLGLKNTLYKFNISHAESMEILEKLNSHENMIRAEISDIHNVIYGAIDFASELGFKPHKDFDLTEYILNPDLITDGIDEIEFGKNGMPLYIAGPYDNTKKILATLNQTIGE